MNDLVTTTNDGASVTTSLAISEGVDSPHASVIKVIRNNIDDFNDFERVRFEIQPFETKGGVQNREVAILNEQHATLLMTFMRNTKIIREFKKRLVKEFWKMRSGASKVVRTRLQIIGMAMEAELARIKLEEQIAEEKPLVEFAKQVEVSHGAIKVSEAAKILGTGSKRLFSFLRMIKWVTRKNEPYQAKIEDGCMDVKLGSWTHPDHGIQQSVTALVTGKGLAKLQALWESASLKKAS